MCSHSFRRHPVKMEENGPESLWSEWKRPLVAVALTFLCNVESSMLAMGEWPYMITIDHESTSTFFGYATAANKAGHAIFAFVFAIWAHKLSGIRIPMLVGRCITLISCVMYIFVEFVPSNRRWWMLLCYLLFGVGFGTAPLLRSYIARVTSEENRLTAYALQAGAAVMSVVVGPFAQLAFSGISYPGIHLLPPHIKLNVYTAPIWFSVITNVIAIAVTVFMLEEAKEKTDDTNRSTSTSPVSFVSIKNRLISLRSLSLPWALIALVIFEKMVSGLFHSTAGAIGGPMLSSMYALSGKEIVMLMAISQVVVGSTALSLSFGFVLCKLGSRLSSRVLFAVSNILVFSGYVLTYAYPFTSTPLQQFNETTRTGCDPLKYSWCDSQLVANLIFKMAINITVISLALPCASMSLDTIYSKMIGNIDQNVMQAVITVASDTVAIIGPIYGSVVFTSLGLNFINIISGSVYFIATIIWLAAWKSVEPYS